jgi:hypothetical protein
MWTVPKNISQWPGAGRGRDEAVPEYVVGMSAMTAFVFGCSVVCKEDEQDACICLKEGQNKVIDINRPTWGKDDGVLVLTLILPSLPRPLQEPLRD